MISVSVPCSCGEFIQGKFGDDEALISCPIDIYSTVTVKNGLQKTEIMEKCKQAIDLTFEYFNIEKKYLNKLSIDIETPLPHGKGYATSTSEIAAVIIAIARYFDKSISEIEVAKLCVEIEPTDSVMFREITLFKHLKGDVVTSIKKEIHFNIVILELDDCVNTVKLRDEGAFNISVEDSRANFYEFLNALENSDYKNMKKSMYKSMILNQIVLKKPYLNEINQMSEKYNSIGVNIAHSGSIVGVLFNNKTDADKFTDEFMNSIYAKSYKTIRKSNVINGGCKIRTSDGGCTCNGINN